MAELLLKKLLLLRARIGRLRDARPSDPEAIASDERLEAFIAFNLFLAIQDALDLGAHLVTERGLAIPATQREVFEALGGAGLLSPDVVRAMGAMVSLRNRIAHSYGELDSVRMIRELGVGLDQLERFADELLAVCSPASGT